MDEQFPVIQGFTPINRPVQSSATVQSSAAATLSEGPETNEQSIGKATTLACKPRKRNGTKTTKADSGIVKPPKKPRATKRRPSKIRLMSPPRLAKAQGLEQSSILSRQDEPLPQSEGSFPDEALDFLPADQMGWLGDFFDTAEETSKVVDADDKFSHLNDKKLPLSDQEDCFEVDRKGKKRRIANNHDILIHEDVETPVQDPFADADLDIELSNLTIPSLKRDHSQSPPVTQRTPPTSPAQKAPTTPYTPGKRKIRVKFIPKRREPTAVTARKPLTPIPTPNTTPHQISFAPDGKPIPVIRPPFPASVLPRSPVTGVSPTTVLRTCLRVGEALNAASFSLRNSVDALIELYCRCKYSDREPNGYKQYFELVDLFTPDRSPVLNGVYAIWKGVGLWELDSSVFLGDKGRGKMARVLGRIRRGEGGKGWELTILSIWEATWEDVEVVKGVICA